MICSISASRVIPRAVSSACAAADRLVLVEPGEVALVGALEDGQLSHPSSSTIAGTSSGRVAPVPAVDHDHRGIAAAARTLDQPEGDLAVVGGLAHPDSELFLEGVDHLLRTDERAREVRADSTRWRPTGSRLYMS